LLLYNYLNNKINIYDIISDCNLTNDLNDNFEKVLEKLSSHMDNIIYEIYSKYILNENYIDQFELYDLLQREFDKQFDKSLVYILLGDIFMINDYSIFMELFYEIREQFIKDIEEELLIPDSYLIKKTAYYKKLQCFNESYITSS